MRWVLQFRSRPAISSPQQIMPSRGSTGRPKVDRSTSPLPRKPEASPVNPVQELKALFSEPASNLRAPSNGEKESDFRFEAIQCLRQSSIIKRPKDLLPERGNWSSKVRRKPMCTMSGQDLDLVNTTSTFFFFKDRIYFVRRGIGHRFGESVAISVPLL